MRDELERGESDTTAVMTSGSSQTLEPFPCTKQLPLYIVLVHNV